MQQQPSFDVDRQILESACLMSRMNLKIAAGLVGILIPVQEPQEAAKTQAASHSQEDFMTRLMRSGQNILQVLSWTWR